MCRNDDGKREKMSLRGMLKVHVDGEERKRKQQKEVEGNTPYNRIDEKGRSKVEVEVGSDSEPLSVEDESGQHYAGNDAREEDEALYNNFSDQVEELVCLKWFITFSP